MKRQKSIILLIIVIVASISVLSACSIFKKTVTVKLYLDENTFWQDLKLDNRGDVEASIEIPTREGYTFKGFNDAQYEQYISPEGVWNRKIAGNGKSLYAVWVINTYSVYFHSGNYATSSYTLKTVNHGEKISDYAPENAVADGYFVTAWSTEMNDTALNSVVSTVTQDELHLYPTGLMSAIIFDSNGGSPVDSIVGNTGTKINLPSPRQADANFIGWYNGSVPYTDDTLADGITNLTAHYTYNVTVRNGDGTSSKYENVSYNQEITLPDYYEKENLVFAGWYDRNSKQISVSGNKFRVSIGGEIRAKYYKYKTETFDDYPGEYKSGISKPGIDFYYHPSERLIYSLNQCEEYTIKFTCKLGTTGYYQSGFGRYGVNFYPSGDMGDPGIKSPTDNGGNIYKEWHPFSFEKTVSASDNKVTSKFIVSVWTAENSVNAAKILVKESKLELIWLDKTTLYD